MEQKYKQTLQDVESILHENPSKSENISLAADQLMDMVIALTCEKHDRDAADRALSLLGESLTQIEPQEMLADYIKAFLAFFAQKYDDYIKCIDLYIGKYIATSKVITYEKAELDYFSVFATAFENDPTFESADFLHKFHTVLMRHCRYSAFEEYVKYLYTEFKKVENQKKTLLSIVESDSTWACAYSHLGDLYSEQADWENAVDFYEKAVATSDFQKKDSLYFAMAWAYGKLKDYVKEEQAYRNCLDITPSFPNANNNLGYCLVRQKRYEESFPLFDKSIAAEPDKFYSYRNKFDALKKLGRKADALDLVKVFPQHFNTKHYQKEIKELMGNFAETEDVFKGLMETTESEYAGKMHVADGHSGIQLYPHQQDAIRALDSALQNTDDYAGLLVLPTGGGKTLTATYWLMERLLDRGKKIIWLAHRHELLNQALQSFERVCYRDISGHADSYHWRVLSGQHDKPLHIKPTDDILIASKTSLKRGFSYLLNQWLKENSDRVFVVIDEAHHAAASEYRDLIDGIKAHTTHFQMLGLTATPFRTVDKEQGMLKKIFPDDIVYKIDLRELVNRGILSEPIFKAVPTDINMVELFTENNSEEALQRIAQDSFFDIESIGKNIAYAIAENSKRNGAIVNEYVKNKDLYGQTLVFALNVDMAIALNGLFNTAGIRSDFVVSDIRDAATHVTISSEENAVKIQRFRDGELDVLVNVNILTEGTDMPKVSTVFLTRPTKSAILMTQMIGRALRGEKAGGTKDAYIVSFIDDWQDKIAWVNPEQLFIDENVDFTKKDHETQKKAMRLVSIAKLEEFANIVNGTVDPRLSEISFLERVPVGIYQFSYLMQNGDGEEEIDKSCNVLVYDCMKEAYEQLLAWLPSANLTNVDAAVNHVDATVFGTLDLLLGYSKQDVADLIRYYKQTGEVPELILLSERGEYDITKLAQHIVEDDLAPSARKEYMENEWNRGGGHWSAFFGTDNKKAFRKLIYDAVDRIQNPEDYTKPNIKPLTQKETVKVQELPLYEIRRRFPELEKKLRDAVFAKYMDNKGYYYSAQGGYRSKNRLDFQIDHIKPMAHGGLTTLDNLQLLTQAENAVKGDKQ